MAEVGEGVACFLVAGGDVNCFGLDSDGQLGVQPGTAVDTYAPVRVSLPAAARKVDVGYARSCAVLVNGEVWCWGRNSFAFLGTPTDELPYSADPVRLEVPFEILDVFIDWFGGCLLDLDRRAWCWGVALDDTWPPKPWQPDLQFEKLAIGDKNVCGLTTDRRVFCEGDNPGLGTDPNARAGFVDIAGAIEQAEREECYGLCPAP